MSGSKITISATVAADSKTVGSVDGRRMTYTMEDGRKVTTTFEARGDSTEIKTVFDAETQNSEEMQKQGWQAIMNNFKSHVETKS